MVHRQISGPLRGVLPHATRNGLPATRSYRYQNADAVREAEVQEILARIRQQARGEPDTGPGYEWHREALLAEAEEPPAVLAVPPQEPPGRCEGCGYLVTWCCCPGGPRS